MIRGIMKSMGICILFCVLTFVYSSCQPLANFQSDRSQARNLKLLKRGVLEKGVYKNEYYEFEMQLPRGWIGKTGDPPVILEVHPPEKEIADDSARKFVDITVHVADVPKDETVETSIQNYVNTNQYEIVSKNENFIEKADSIICILNGKLKEQNIRLLSLVVRMDDRVIIIQCQALRPLYDNVEAHFRYCLGSFKVTSRPVTTQLATPTPSPYSYETDYFTYIVQKGDDASSIAKRFMGNEDRDWLIKEYNSLESFTDSEKIKIPRSMPYRIAPEDTWESVASKLMGDLSYAGWLKEYNNSTWRSEGEMLYIPLYKIEKTLPRETYLDLAQRTLGQTAYADLLLLYNNEKSLNSLENAKIPLFLIKHFYTYTIESGDTLALIASWLTGDSRNYSIIAEVNNITNPSSLRVGQVIKIPANLITDPSVFSKPKPRPAKPATQPKPASETEKPFQKPPVEEAAPTPVPEVPEEPVIVDGMYEPE